MSELKCPFCQQELLDDIKGEYGCSNSQCQKSVFMFGSRELWQELIRTREELKIAFDALDMMVIDDNVSGMVARNAVKQIKALEQKDERWMTGMK